MCAAQVMELEVKRQLKKIREELHEDCMCMTRISENCSISSASSSTLRDIKKKVVARNRITHMKDNVEFTAKSLMR